MVVDEALEHPCSDKRTLIIREAPKGLFLAVIIFPSSATLNCISPLDHKPLIGFPVNGGSCPIHDAIETSTKRTSPHT